MATGSGISRYIQEQSGQYCVDGNIYMYFKLISIIPKNSFLKLDGSNTRESILVSCRCYFYIVYICLLESNGQGFET